MTTATDPKTGQRYELVGGRWQPISRREEAPASANVKPEPLLEGGRLARAGQALLVGAGDTINTGRMNVQDLWASITGDQAMQQSIAEERADAQMVRERLREEAPIASTVGGMVPSLIAAPLGGASILGQIGAGAGLSAITSQSGELGFDAAIGAALGAGGMGAQNIVQRVVSGRAAAREARTAARAAASELTQGEREVIDGARRAGMVVLPGQAAGNKFMRQMEASMASHPMTSGVFAEVEQANKAQLNRLAARAMGVDGADSVSAEVRAVAEQQLSQRFEQVGRAIGPVDTAPLQKALRELGKEESTALLPRTELDNIMARFERGQGARSMAVAGEPVDQVSGVALMRERSRIARQMRDAYARNDSSAGELYGNVLNAMDEAVERAAIRTARGDPSAGEALLRQYSSAREQWNVLRAMDRGGASIDGNVMPGQAARLIRSGDKGGFWGLADDAGQTIQKRGTGIVGQNPTGDFYDALRFAGSQIGRPVVGDSGTATRLSLTQAMQGGMVAVGITGARRFAESRLARAYAGMSPQAAMTAAAVAQGMRNPGQAPRVVDALRVGGLGALGGAL